MTPSKDAQNATRTGTDSSSVPFLSTHRTRNLSLTLTLLLATATTTLLGCDASNRPYGRENKVVLSIAPGAGPRVWAVAPTLNLSGQKSVDPLLQSDLCFQQLQDIKGLVVIPVDRTAAVYASLGIDRVQTPEQADLVCDLLNVDALLVPTVTAYEPYNPPKMGGSLALFVKPSTFTRPQGVDPRVLVRQMSPVEGTGMPTTTEKEFYQSVGMFDAANGSVRESITRYAYGRQDPVGPYGEKELYVSADRYATFVWRRLTEGVLDQMFARTDPTGRPVDPAETAHPGQPGAKNTPQKPEKPEGGPAGPQPFPSNRR